MTPRAAADTAERSRATRGPRPGLTGMAQRTRRPRGTAVGHPVIFASVAEPAKQIVIDTADALGISQAAALEAILLALPLDRDGVPAFVDRTRLNRNEELPIPAA